MRKPNLTWLIGCLLLGAAVSVIGGAPALAQQSIFQRDLQFGDGSQWRCLGGEWAGEGAAFVPPATPRVRNTHSRAFYVGHAYADATIEFEYRPGIWEAGSGMAGVILRAQDGGHYYIVHFPFVGQAYRGKHFWAGLGKVSGDGYVRYIKFQLVPGVPSELQRWYAVRVETAGPRIRAWVNGRLALDATDDTYASGFIGLSGYGAYEFRNLRISSMPQAPPAWDETVKIARPAVTLPLPSDPMTTGCLAPNGDVLIGSGRTLLRSTDKGRTWQKEEMDENLDPFAFSGMGAVLHRTRDDRLIVHGVIGGYVTEVESKAHGFYMAESTDSGKTWSKMTLRPLKEDAEWPPAFNKGRLYVYGQLTETEDGTLIRFLYTGIDIDSPYDQIYSWGSTHCKAMAFRSTDGGATWSGPIEIDRPAAFRVPRGSVPGALDFTETTGVAIGNRVTTVIRPIYSPWMWQCWSDDAGATWDTAVRTTFPGYAQAMIRTASGAIVVAHRYPAYTVHVSRDDGLNWDQGTLIDYPTWAMGCLIEVEPDVLLATYMNSCYGDVKNLRNEEKSPLMMQRFRVTADRIVPLGPDE